jgi:hypothetical protein
VQMPSPNSYTSATFIQEGVIWSLMMYQDYSSLQFSIA